MAAKLKNRQKFKVHKKSCNICLKAHHYIFNSSHLGTFWLKIEPIATKLWWNDPWMVPFQNCVRCSRLPTKMAAKLKIEKRGDEIFKKILL
jgi:hypothetical protein